MSKILKKEELEQKLREYYSEKFGEDENDEWLFLQAVNVWCFKRGGKYISLKAHILSGKVEELVEEAK